MTNGFGSSSSGITINNGAVLKLNVHHRINNDVPILIQSGGTFDMNGNSDIIGTISGAGSIINNNHPEGLQLDLADGTTQIFSGSISGSGGLSLRGTNSTTNAGTLIITGIQAYSGQTGICYSYDTDSNIDQAKVKLVLAGGNNRLSPSTVINFGHKTSTGVTGKLILGNASGPSNQTVSGLTDTSGPGTFYVVGGNTNVSILTVNNSSDYIYNGYIGGPDTNENKIALVK